MSSNIIAISLVRYNVSISLGFQEIKMCSPHGIKEVIIVQIVDNCLVVFGPDFGTIPGEYGWAFIQKNDFEDEYYFRARNELDKIKVICHVFKPEYITEKYVGFTTLCIFEEKYTPMIIDIIAVDKITTGYRLKIRFPRQSVLSIDDEGIFSFGPSISHVDIIKDSNDFIYKFLDDTKQIGDEEPGVYTKTSKVNSVEFIIKNGILKKYNGIGGSIIIPEGVIEIAKNVFYKRSDITSVQFPSSLVAIRYRAFCLCKKLTSLKFPPNLKIIESEAFDQDSHINKVTFPDNLTEIGQNAFRTCSISQLTLPKNMKEVCYSSFSDTSGISSDTFHDCLEKINDYAFSFSSGVDTIKFPKNLKEIGHNAFMFFKNTKTFFLPYNTIIYSDSFDNRVKIEKYGENGNVANKDFGVANNILTSYTGKDSKIRIPEGIIEISERVFSMYYRIKEVSFPESLIRIGPAAFWRCENLEAIEIPKNLSDLAPNTFFGCYKLSNFMVSPCNASYSVKEGLLYDKHGKKLLLCPSNITTLYIPEGTEEIGSNAFQNCGVIHGNITEYLPLNITLPKGLKYLYSESFRSCFGLSSIILPDTVLEIGDSSFMDCRSLSSIAFSDSLITIGKNAFSNCDSLTKVLFPKHLKTINESAFSTCMQLISVIFNEEIISIEKSVFSYCRNIQSIILPNSLKEIQTSAFLNCSGIKTIEFSEGLLSIGKSAFYGCASIRSITLPKTLKEIGTRAFANCINLQTIKIHQGTILGTNVFIGCPGKIEFYEDI
jgi:hypothetical protein